MKSFLKYITLISFLSFTGCAGIGVVSPTTFNEKLAVAYGTVTEIGVTTSTLLKAGKIKSDDAQNVHDQAVHAKTGLDIARSMSSIDITSASGKLEAIRTVLTALTTYLATKQ